MQVAEHRSFAIEHPTPWVRRIGVTWQHPRTRRYHPVGLLEQRQGGFRFSYLATAPELLGPRTLLGFPRYDRVYSAENLFPLFASRLMDPARPERPRLLEALSLDALAGPLELLARSGGRRTGDSLELVPEPSVNDVEGTTDCLFLVHGIRYVPDADAALARLQRGDALALVDDEENAVNPLAVLVQDERLATLGWVPDPLVTYVRRVRDLGDFTLRVERVNGSEFGQHLRLLVHLSGAITPGYRPFSGPDWATAASTDASAD